MARTINEPQEAQFKEWDKLGYTVIPPSGKFRDLIRQLPHIMDVLGCRILHLLPVNPTPTTFARFGRFGSPYATLDLTAIDPALVEFDKRTTGVDQFCELAYAVHLKGGRVFLDMIINHTGWGSVLQENRPEWFLRGPKGEFVSPGAWGTIWEDLVELEHRHVTLWDELAEDFLVWCRRGVDEFPVRRRLQGAPASLAVHHGAGKAAISGHHFSAGRSRRGVGIDGTIADGRRDAMGRTRSYFKIIPARRWRRTWTTASSRAGPLDCWCTTAKRMTMTGSRRGGKRGRCCGTGSARSPA